MSAERDKNILIGSGIFIAGFISGVSALIWLLNRNVEEKPDGTNINQPQNETTT